MELAWHWLKLLNWVQVCIVCLHCYNSSCQNLFCQPQKSCWPGHRKRSQTVRNDLDCFKLSKWSDESPLMGRPLRLLFYLGLPLSIQTAFPMHKPHNTIHYSTSHTVSCWTLYSLLQIKLDPTLLLVHYTVSTLRCTTQYFHKVQAMIFLYHIIV